ncbi:hypothetical protein [Actinomadura rugatobispora]|uniref:DUF3180 domain-containing protein n=1 Tax=Actinomadura rugatobispora TaxID=1994 RepID=A0ABW1A0Z9_9ACTN|nr:hypothetical protein GCM10010200_065750 [Actinomadura rugatobispora]
MKPRNKREERLLELTQERPKRWSAGRAGRRRAVLLCAGLLGLLWVNAGVSYALAPSDAAMFTCFAIIAVVVVAASVLFRALIVGTRGTIGLPEHLLDERQRGERLRAHALSHRLTLILLFVVYFAVPAAVGSDDSISRIPSAAVFLLFAALLATVAVMPTLVIAWRVPEPPGDGEDGEDDAHDNDGHDAYGKRA